MPIAFSRSIRSLHADGRSRRAIWFLLIPAVVLGAWTVWFFKAPIARYEVSNRARYDGSRIIAEFHSTGSIHPGQRAYFGGKSAHVTNVNGASVELALDRPANLPQGSTGKVEVQVEFLTPAAMLLRANRQAP